MNEILQHPLGGHAMKLPRLKTRAIALASGAVILLSVACVVGLAIEASRNAGLRMACQSNLHQICLALFSYSTASGSFPPATLPRADQPPERRLSWVVLILPWTDYFQNVEIMFEPNRPWDSPENLRPRCKLYEMEGPDRVVESMELPGLPVARCPARLEEAAHGSGKFTSYVGIAGLGTDAPTLPVGHARAGVFGYDRQTRLEDFKDGISATMMLAETELANGPWTAGGPATVRGLDPSRQPYIGRGRQFGGLHRGGVNLAFADGSVRFLSETIDRKVFEALSTVAGGESLPAGWDR
jgi:prepilin-type processing-associated H-X9-DG protein